MAFDLKSARHWAEELHRAAILPGMVAVDATMGNGGDTLRLCELVGEAGKVYAFDVQDSAVERTRERLRSAGFADRAILHCAGHERIAELIPEPIDAAVFNLGWLPGADKHITTRAQTTLMALDACAALLRARGLITICAYPGHAEGADELARVTQWARALDPARFAAMRREYLGQKNNPPVMIAIQRIRAD